MKPIRFIDLFGGIGGFRYGLEQVNKQLGQDIYKCVWYNDFDKYAVSVYNKNFREQYEPTDITKIKTEDIPDFDMLCGGFPCQAFSIAGKRRGFEDTRGTLFFEIARIIKDKKPKIILLENVKGLLNHNKGETFKVILQTLRQLGYRTEWMVLNSKFFGVPQNRERVFIVGYLGEGCKRQVLSNGKYATEIQGLSEEETEKLKIIKYKDVYGKHQQDSVYDIDGIMGTLPGGTHGSTPHLTKIVEKNSIISPCITTENAHTYGNNVTPGQTKAIAESEKLNADFIRKHQRIMTEEEVGQTLTSKGFGSLGKTGILAEKTYKCHRADEIREHDGSPTLTKNMGTGGHNVPIVMNLQKRDINRPAIRKRIEAGLKPNAGSGTIGKEDEAYCLDAGCNQGVSTQIVASRGRNPKNPSDRTVGAPTEQRLEPNSEGISNTLSTVQKDNMLSEYGKLRRLTPIECERLQGFPDDWTKQGWNPEKFSIINISDTQRYRQLGNAVTTKVITYIGGLIYEK